MPGYPCSPYQSGLFFRHQVFHQRSLTFHCEERTPRTNKVRQRRQLGERQKGATWSPSSMESSSDLRLPATPWCQVDIQPTCCITPRRSVGKMHKNWEKSWKRYSSNKFFTMRVWTHWCVRWNPLLMEDQSPRYLMIQGISMHSHLIISCCFERKQQSHLVYFPRKITTPVTDGAKCNILATSSGHAGPESACRHCSNVKSGTSHSVISPRMTLCFFLMRICPTVFGH